MHLRAALVCVAFLAPACGSNPDRMTEPTTTGATDKTLVNVDERGVGLGATNAPAYGGYCHDGQPLVFTNALVAKQGK